MDNMEKLKQEDDTSHEGAKTSLGITTVAMITGAIIFIGAMILIFLT